MERTACACSSGARSMPLAVARFSGVGSKHHLSSFASPVHVMPSGHCTRGHERDMPRCQCFVRMQRHACGKALLWRGARRGGGTAHGGVACAEGLVDSGDIPGLLHDLDDNLGEIAWGRDEQKCTGPRKLFTLCDICGARRARSLFSAETFVGLLQNSKQHTHTHTHTHPPHEMLHCLLCVRVKGSALLLSHHPVGCCPRRPASPGTARAGCSPRPRCRSAARLRA